MNAWGGEKRIIEQRGIVEGIVTKYADGSTEVLPYLVDGEGFSYTELFPNDADADTWMQSAPPQRTSPPLPHRCIT